MARGLSVDLAVASWLERRRYRAADFSVEELRCLKGAHDGHRDRARQGVCRDDRRASCARRSGPLVEAGLVDELVVVDAGSADGTAQAAARCGRAGPAAGSDRA